MAEKKKGPGCFGILVCCIVCGLVNMAMNGGGSPQNLNSTSPAPYVNGEPGFQTLDSYNYDNTGKRVPNEEKALMRDAINKFEAAQAAQGRR